MADILFTFSILLAGIAAATFWYYIELKKIINKCKRGQ
jgi:hypothetical protein